jgi:aminoglycoside phosphotransferase (APT) family kinase protein
MAVKSKLDLSTTSTKMSAWLAERLNATGVTVSGLTQPASGFSADTLMFDARWSVNGREQQGGMVARVAPTGEALFPAYDLLQEARIIKALGAAGTIPVPTIIGDESDASVLGAPFFVMERIAGRIPPDSPPFTAEGWVFDLSPDQRRRLDENALAALAALHSTDLEQLGLSDLADSGGASKVLDRQLGYWRDFYAWTGGPGSNPVIDAALTWLDDHRPTEAERTVLNWGDARHPNLIFSDDLEVAAVLDWEMASVGSPEIDLGYWIFGVRHHTEGMNVPLPEGFLDREATIARYEELTGHRVVNLEFYEAFAALRAAIVIGRLAGLMIEAGLLPPDSNFGQENGATRLLSHTVGIKIAAAESYHGSVARKVQG